ncbi:MAG: acylphosphatase [Myxococcota bacterium]
MTTDDGKVRARVFISGRVQGVFFRDSTQQQARRRGVAGWVRNLVDGRVEAVLEGRDEAVRAILDWCRDGPPAARVEDVEVRWETPEGLDRFETLSTA